MERYGLQLRFAGRRPKLQTISPARPQAQSANHFPFAGRRPKVQTISPARPQTQNVNHFPFAGLMPEVQTISPAPNQLAMHVANHISTRTILGSTPNITPCVDYTTFQVCGAKRESCAAVPVPRFRPVPSKRGGVPTCRQQGWAWMHVINVSP